MFYRIRSCRWSWNEKNRTYPSSSSHVTHVTVGVNCHTCQKKIIPTMAPKKRFGVGAECTVSLLFLHLKDKIAEKIPNQTMSQKLSVLVVVHDDNMPAVENIPQQDTNNNNNNNNNDIMLGWEHSGICERRLAIRTNATPVLKSLNTSDEVKDPTNLQLFDALFFKSFIQSIIIPKTNANFGGREKSPMANSFVGWDVGV